jgi:hypothetical protein
MISSHEKIIPDIEQQAKLGGLWLQHHNTGFALADRQVDGLQPIIACLETQDLVVGEHGAVVTDNPKLEVNVHGRWHAEVFRKLQETQPSNYPPSPAQATNLLRFLLLSLSTGHAKGPHDPPNLEDGGAELSGTVPRIALLPVSG